MRLSDTDIIRLLPAFVRDDEAGKGLSLGVNTLTPQLYRLITLFSVWDKIDEMSDADLDEMAWELNVEWYDPTASLATKRQLIKQADLVHSRLGTKWAVEQVISAHFGAGQVREWFEYGGEPHHFKVLSDNPSITNEHIDKFMRVLNIVKRTSSWLDSILISLTGEMHLTVGVAFRNSTVETQVIGPTELHLYHGALMREVVRETHSIRRSD